MTQNILNGNPFQFGGHTFVVMEFDGNRYTCRNKFGKTVHFSVVDEFNFLHVDMERVGGSEVVDGQAKLRVIWTRVSDNEIQNIIEFNETDMRAVEKDYSFTRAVLRKGGGFYDTANSH